MGGWDLIFNPIVYERDRKCISEIFKNPQDLLSMHAIITYIKNIRAFNY